MAPLFEPLRAGALKLRNRIVMAPMTRRRAGDGGVPTELNARYYAQRASAGLIVSEASVVAPAAGGVPGSPGIHTDAQVEGWRGVVDAVHDEDGLIVLQLWHAGRVSHPDWLDGTRPVAPSPIAPSGELPVRPGGPYPEPRTLDAAELPGVAEAFVTAAVRAREAGFDGVEIHAAQGYLLDQFLRASANQRRDAYGGSPQNRIRLLLEVVDAVADAWAADRIGVQVSPTSRLNDMSDPDPVGLFSLLAQRLALVGLAYLHVHEPIDGENGSPRVAVRMRERFPGVLMLNGGYDGVTATRAVAGGAADLISFGRSFIANPDLPHRIAVGAPLRHPDPRTFYGGGAEGYTDYPRIEDPRQAGGRGGHVGPAP